MVGGQSVIFLALYMQPSRYNHDGLLVVDNGNEPSK